MANGTQGLNPITKQPLSTAQAAFAAFPAAAYAAKLDPQDPQGVNHVVIQGLPFLVDAAHDYISLVAARLVLPNTTENVVKVRAEVSFDGGLNWQLLVGFHATGGQNRNQVGQIDPLTWCATRIPGAGTSRLVRVQLIPMQDLTTQIDVLTEALNIVVQPGEQPHSVSFDSVGTSSGTTISGASTASWTHTPSGTPTACSVQVGWFNSSSASISNVHYGATSLTANVTSGNTTGNNAASIWGAANPASGAQTVSITFSAGVFGVVGSLDVVGSNTTTCFSGTGSGAVGNSATPSVTVTSAVGELVVSALRIDSGTSTWTPGSGQTNRWYSSTSNLAGASDTENGAASVTMDGTLGTSGVWAIAGASFKNAASGAGGPLTKGGSLTHGSLVKGGRLVP